ncbi:MAG: glycosyltransferase family 2 protein [Pseudomonadota bacterium]
MFKFSLILATYGRKAEIERFLQSLVVQELDSSEFEIIIVDQNDKIQLESLVRKYENKLNIKHLKIKEKGLSLARNKGLEISSGEIIAFPDDDCEYYPSTLSIVANKFCNDHSIDILLGKIVDKDGNNIIRNWSSMEFAISIFNFYTNLSSITIFIKITGFSFDEDFGVGAKYGSCEDVDLIFSFLKEKNRLIYYPDVIVYHPDQGVDNIDIQKISKYGIGFGAFCRKHIGLLTLNMFISIVAYHFLKLIISLIKVDFKNVIKRWSYIKSRIKGFATYER